MEKVKYIFEKFNIAKYIVNEYANRFDGTLISSLKLQKSLYLLFAKWGGLIVEAKTNNKKDSEVDFSEFHEYLFNPTFLAWRYGPTDKDIYEWFVKTENHKKINNKNIELRYMIDISDFEKQTINDFIDYLLPRLFITSDFALVELVHQDNCWKNARENATECPIVIPNDEIIKEYINKVF